jgi:hypothetical protein
VFLKNAEYTLLFSGGEAVFAVKNAPENILTHLFKEDKTMRSDTKDKRHFFVTVVWGCFLLSAFVFPIPVYASGEIVAWGANNIGQCNVPLPNTGFIAIAAGGNQALGLKTDGSIVAWGDNTWGECTVPLPNTNFIAVAAGNYHSLGLKTDGSIVAWGFNVNGDPRLIVPLPNTNFKAIAAGNGSLFGLKTNGSIVAWGDNGWGECDVPSPNIGFTAIAACGYHALGLKTDGSIVAWGANNYGQSTVPSPNTGFTAIAAGWDHSLGMKQGSIVAWGSNYDYWGNYTGQCVVPNPNTGFKAITAGWSYSLGLKTDGSVVAWGYNGYGQCNVPSPNTGFTAIAAGGGAISLGLASPPSCDPAPSGLVGWWKADGNAVDSVAGNNGIMQLVDFTDGVVGQAFLFHYNYFPPHSRISVPDKPEFALTDSLSIEGWINSAGAGNDGVILWRGDCRGGYDPYFFQIMSDNTLGFTIEDATPTAATVTTTNPLAVNQWYHVAATLNGNTGDMSIYVNGVLAAQTNTSIRPFGPLIPSLEPTIGIGNVGTSCWDYVPFNGAIDEISLYSRALSQSEIQAIYNAGSSGKCFETAPVANAGPNQVVYAWIDGMADVNLDGSGSYDADGDPLTYKWTWTIDANTYEANGVNPPIELSIGKHVVSLIVNDGTFDSEPNVVVITVIAPFQGNLDITPKILNCRSNQPNIMAMMRMPKGVTRDQIDTNQPILLYPGAIEANSLSINPQACLGRINQGTTILASFDKDKLMAAIDANGTFELAVVGQLKTGQYFYGTDDIRVICPGNWPNHKPWWNYKWNRWCKRTI